MPGPALFAADRFGAENRGNGGAVDGLPRGGSAGKADAFACSIAPVTRPVQAMGTIVRAGRTGADEQETEMTTHAQLAARLLREAAHIYRTLGAEDPELREKTEEFAELYDQVADLVEDDPQGIVSTV
jgi:hypothetical protein